MDFPILINWMGPFSDLGLYCLPMSPKWDARLLWVKFNRVFKPGNVINMRTNKAENVFSESVYETSYILLESKPRNLVL